MWSHKRTRNGFNTLKLISGSIGRIPNHLIDNKMLHRVTNTRSLQNFNIQNLTSLQFSPNSLLTWVGSNFTKVINDIIPQQPLNVHNGLPLGFALQITWIALKQSKPEPNQEHLEDHQSQIMIFGLQNKSQGHVAHQEVAVGWCHYWLL